MDYVLEILETEKIMYEMMSTVHSYSLTPLVYILFDVYHSQHIAHRHQNQQGESWP